MKSALIISPFFPPSPEPATYRTWSLCGHLEPSGIIPITLTRDLRGKHPDKSFDLTETQKKRIYRPFTIDAKRDLSIFGKHLEIQTVPDEWWIWKLFAVRLGKKLIERYQPNVIWSTYPAISAHMVALKLAKWSGLPWIADYQDPLMYHLQHRTGLDSFKASINRMVDARVIQRCDLAVFATEQASELYGRLYPEQEHKFRSIPNGYDESAHENISSLTQGNPGNYVLYSGVLYEGDSIRDPEPLFEAIKLCRDTHLLDPESLEMRFRGAGDGTYYQATIAQRDIEPYIKFAPRISFIDSLAEINAARVLVLIQRAGTETQIPGKAYEYLRSGRPIVAITPCGSATAELMESYSDSGIIVSEDPLQIAAFINDVHSGKTPSHFVRDISMHSRDMHSKKYVSLVENYVN